MTRQTDTSDILNDPTVSLTDPAIWHPVPKFTVPTTPEAITEDNWYPLVNNLMKSQMAHTASELLDNAHRWGEDFISDDGTDYTTSALDACADLMALRYEGDRDDLTYWLFGPVYGCEPHANEFNLDPHMGSPTGGNPPRTLRDIDSAGGLCNELVDFIHNVWPL